MIYYNGRILIGYKDCIHFVNDNNHDRVVLHRICEIVTKGKEYSSECSFSFAYQ